MYLLFDFDGTLVNSFDVVMEKYIQLSNEFNFQKINSFELENMRNFTSKELIEYLKIPNDKISVALEQIRAHLHNQVERLEPFPNLIEVLRKLHKQDISLGIVTSNSKENVLAWLRHYEIEHLFNFIDIDSSYFGKEHILKKVLAEYKIEKSRVFYVGDETRDIEAAKHADIYSLAVTWGFNSEQTLLQYHPHYVARKPEDIVKACLSLEQ